ncbi:PREDICTED: uncharacterized protein LOC104770831 [Camelina sativa]|uniref:Uncharacterized protein LOC104770831 n=1 Tax=Camelina sativa TaxID=90675 RepID=A0ABM0Y0E7_CAMSA|nr:PREDICTED: uncharacterized protein LOC104770831 [Camelina sativa]
MRGSSPSPHSDSSSDSTLFAELQCRAFSHAATTSSSQLPCEIPSLIEEDLDDSCVPEDRIVVRGSLPVIPRVVGVKRHVLSHVPMTTIKLDSAQDALRLGGLSSPLPPMIIPSPNQRPWDAPDGYIYNLPRTLLHSTSILLLLISCYYALCFRVFGFIFFKDSGN